MRQDRIQQCFRIAELAKPADVHKRMLFQVWVLLVVEVVQERLGLPRDTPLKKTLFACDELSGFVHACGLVRPTGIDGLEPKSVKKKLKTPSFAAGVHRDEVFAGAEGLGLELDDHIRNVVEAMQPIAAELGLRTAATEPATTSPDATDTCDGLRSLMTPIVT